MKPKPVHQYQNLGPKLLVFFFCGFLLSCNLTKDEMIVPNAAFHFIQLSPAAPPLTIYVNNEKIAENFIYGEDSGYYEVQPGLISFKVSETGSNDFLIDNYTALTGGLKYSIFTVDSFSSIKLTSVRDNFIGLSGDTAGVRFLYMSADTAILNVKLFNTRDSISYPSRYFNDQHADTTRASFRKIRAGTFNLSLLQRDSTVYGFFDNINLETNRFYTVYIKGFKKGTGADSLDKGIIRY